MNKKKKGKIKYKNLLLVISIVLIIGFISFKILTKKINNIYIEGNNYLKEQDILELLNINEYQEYYKIFPKKLEKRLKLSPYIKEVKVKKTLFSLTIKIKENNILWYQEYNNSIMLSTGTEVVLENYIEGIPLLINNIDEEYFEKTIKEFSKIDLDILHKISEIKYDPATLDKERFLLYMNDRNYVYITLSKASQLNKYSELVVQLDGKKGILHLDSGNHFEIKK